MVRRGLTESRNEARRLISEGVVIVAGRPSARPATMVAPEEPIELIDAPRWASRAGGKLAAALEAFPIDPAGARALDVGASTGGFTDVLLGAGVASVVALDVGYGQLLWRLRTDPRVEVRDRTNFRTIDAASLGEFDIVVVDVSFISVALLAHNLGIVGAAGADYVVLVKPQFEVGRDQVPDGGVVTDVILHRAATRSVAAALAAEGVAPLAIIPSPVVGSSGNQEYLLHCRKGAEGADADDIAGAIAG